MASAFQVAVITALIFIACLCLAGIIILSIERHAMIRKFNQLKTEEWRTKPFKTTLYSTSPSSTISNFQSTTRTTVIDYDLDSSCLWSELSNGVCDDWNNKWQCDFDEGDCLSNALKNGTLMKKLVKPQTNFFQLLDKSEFSYEYKIQEMSTD